jgi:GNAT superfamily N-acetyltransferase
MMPFNKRFSSSVSPPIILDGYNKNMKIIIEEISPDGLSEYAAVPISFMVKSVLRVELIEGGLGGMLLHEVPVEPYIKNYDVEETPKDWPKKFDVAHWGFFLAKIGERTVGAAAVAFDTTGVFVLEARRDLSVLWDIRVRPEARGAGIPLFRYAAEWSRKRGCTQMKIETQNVNVPACRFYQKMGASLGEIHRFGYAAMPAVAHEVMLNWYLDLAPEASGKAK